MSEQQAKGEASELARLSVTDPTYFHYRLGAIKQRVAEIREQKQRLDAEIDSLLVLVREITRLTQEAY
jgi:uncharacterized protein involved in exopolysaccharide biosynthesis